MFLVPPQIAAERYKICQSCKHFRAPTKSCGTLILGDRLSPEDLAEAEKANEITHYRKRLRLCGCKMNMKTHLALFRCPVNKWGRYKLTDAETAALREFLSGLPTQGVYTQEHVKQAANWFTKMTGKSYGCSSCNAKVVFNYLKNAIRDASDDDLG